MENEIEPMMMMIYMNSFAFSNMIYNFIFYKNSEYNLHSYEKLFIFIQCHKTDI